MLSTVWCEMARDRDVRWRAVDIEEIDAHTEVKNVDLRTLVITSPEQDPMGVIACASGVARWLLSDAYLADHALDVDTRILLSVVLFAVQKVKTEDHWERGSHVALRVLARFLCADEMGDWMHSARVRAHWYERLHRCEARLVCMPGLASLVDGAGSLYGAFEAALAAMHAACELDDRALIIGVAWRTSTCTRRANDKPRHAHAARRAEHRADRRRARAVVLVTCRLLPPPDVRRADAGARRAVERQGGARRRQALVLRPRWRQPARRLADEAHSYTRLYRPPCSRPSNARSRESVREWSFLLTGLGVTRELLFRPSSIDSFSSSSGRRRRPSGDADLGTPRIPAHEVHLLERVPAPARLVGIGAALQ